MSGDSFESFIMLVFECIYDIYYEILKAFSVQVGNGGIVMIKVDLVAPNLSGKGGTETVLTDVLSSDAILSEFDFSLVLLDNPKSKNWLKSISRKILVNIRTKNNRFFWLLSYLIKTRADIVVVLGPRLAFFSRMIKIAFRKKYKIVTWIHFSLLHQNIMNSSYVKFADYHLAISSQMVDQFEKLGVDRSKIFVIYNPVKKPKKIRDYKRSMKNELYITYIGRVMLDGQKNLRLLISSIKKLSKNYSGKIIIDLWGDGEVTKLKNYIKLMGFDKKVKFNWHGWVENPWNEIEVIDMLVLTSTFEGFGMVLTEAISRGIPVVATDYPVGARDIIVPGVNGELCEYSEDSIVVAILKISRKKADGEQIKATMKKFSFDSFENKFIYSLKEVANN